MISAAEVREHLTCYVTDVDSFSVFQLWLVDRSWDMHKDSDEDTQKLVHAVNESIYDYLDGYVTENDLKAKLRPFVTNQVARSNFRVVARSVIADLRSGSSGYSPQQSQSQDFLAESVS